ncbi:MAG: hypothetical protein ACI8RZ_005402 [Myxococcota bacterium]|jgi:hypothetical protein
MSFRFILPLVSLLGCSTSSGADEAEQRRGLCYTAIERQAGNAIDVHCGDLIPVFMVPGGDLPTRSRAWFHHRSELCAEADDVTLRAAFCEGKEPGDWAGLWRTWGTERLTAHSGAPPTEGQLSMFLGELGLTGDPAAGVADSGCNQDCRWWTAQSERFHAADELSLFYSDTVNLVTDMPARMVAWERACSGPGNTPLCQLKESSTPAEIDTAWDSWARGAISMQHRIYGLVLPEEQIDVEVYRIRRHFQLWGLPWSDRKTPSIGDGHAWVRSGR